MLTDRCFVWLNRFGFVPHFRFGFVPQNGFVERMSGLVSLYFLEAFVKSAFGAHAMGGDAVERFFVVAGQERVDAVGGEGSFEAIGSFDVPGGEEDLGIEGAFDWTGGVEFEAEGDGEGFEGLVVLRS